MVPDSYGPGIDEVRGKMWRFWPWDSCDPETTVILSRSKDTFGQAIYRHRPIVITEGKFPLIRTQASI